MFLFFHTCPSCPCFATLRHSFLGITSHPLANCLAPNPNGRCSPLSFGSLVFSICSPLFLVFSKLCLSSISCLFFKPFPAFSYGFSRVSFPQFPHFPNNFLSFPWFFLACHYFFSSSLMFFSQFSSIFLHFLQPFATPSSVSLLIPLQTVLLRTPMDAALR